MAHSVMASSNRGITVLSMSAFLDITEAETGASSAVTGGLDAGAPAPGGGFTAYGFFGTGG